MKKRNKANIFCLSLVLLWLTVLVTGCDFTPPDTPAVSAASDTRELSRREELAVLKALPSHTVGVDALRGMADGILQAKTDGRSIVSGNSAVITGVNKIPSLTDKRFSQSFGNGRSLDTAEEEPVELYCFTIEDAEAANSGFILMSNDYRIGYVLAVVDDGDLADVENPFTDILHARLGEYIEETIAVYADISEEETLNKRGQL